MIRRRLQVGDIFTIPLDDTRAGMGQVVARGDVRGEYFVAVFEPAFPLAAMPNIREAARLTVALLGLTSIERLKSGEWRVMGNAPVADDMPFPAYKVSLGRGDNLFVEDYTGLKRRPSVGAEADLLPFRTYSSPALLENAFRARHGLLPWDDSYEAILTSRYATTLRMFGSPEDS